MYTFPVIEQKRKEIWRKDSSSADGEGASSSCGQSSEDSCHQLIIPKLVIEEPSPVMPQAPIIILPDSPPFSRINVNNSEEHLLNPYRSMADKKLLRLLERAPPPSGAATSTHFDDHHAGVMKDGKFLGNNLLMPSSAVGMCYLSPFTICTRADRTISESNLSSSGYSSMASPCPSRCGSNNPLCPEDATLGPISSTVLSSTGVPVISSASIADGSSGGSRCSTSSTHQSPLNITNNKSHLKPLQLISNLQNSTEAEMKRTNPGTFRLRSYSDSFHHEQVINDTGDNGSGLLVKRSAGDKSVSNNVNSESNSNGEAVDDADEDDKMLNVHTTESEKPSDSGAPPFCLPSIVIQMEDEIVDEKCSSQTTSRSESPISEWGCADGNVVRTPPVANVSEGQLKPTSSSTVSWERKDLLPFTDSDGLYDFPSSDGRSSLKSAHLQSKRYNLKKRERKARKEHTLLQSGGGKNTGCQLEFTTSSLKELSSAQLTPMPSSSSSIFTHHQCNKFCYSHQQQCPMQGSSRRSPKRRMHLRMNIPNSSSSSDSLNSVIGKKERRLMLNNRKSLRIE